jgi:hypothetical protein
MNPNEQEIRRRLTQTTEMINQMRKDGIDDLKSILTKENLKEVLETFLQDLMGAGIDVEVNDSWSDVYDECHTVDILFDFDHVELISSLVRKVYPHSISKAFRPNCWVHGYRYYIVSKAKFDSNECIVESTIEEDNIGTVSQFIEYVLRHSINHLCKLADMPRHQIQDISTRNMDTAQLRHIFEDWLTGHRCAMWCNLHGRLLDICLALAPLHLSSYELLWILDYAPPMNFKWYKDGKPYDANHLRKLRLYEGVMHSYEMRHP